MKAHPIIESPFRWIPMLVLALILVVFQVALVCGYTGNDYLPALVDGIVTIGWLAAIAYLAWFVVGLVSLFQTDVIMIIVGRLLWLAGSLKVCDIMVRIVGVSYVPFAQTIPFRLLFGLPVLIAITLWYRLIVTKEEVQNQEMEKDRAVWGGELRKHFCKERCSQTAMPFFAVFELYFGLFLSPVQN